MNTPSYPRVTLSPHSHTKSSSRCQLANSSGPVAQNLSPRPELTAIDQLQHVPLP